MSISPLSSRCLWGGPEDVGICPLKFKVFVGRF